VASSRGGSPGGCESAGGWRGDGTVGGVRGQRVRGAGLWRSVKYEDHVHSRLRHGAGRTVPGEVLAFYNDERAHSALGLSDPGGRITGATEVENEKGLTRE